MAVYNERRNNQLIQVALPRHIIEAILAGNIYDSITVDAALRQALASNP